MVVPPLPFDEALAKARSSRNSARACTTRSIPPSIPRRKAIKLVDELKKEILAAIPEDDEERRKLAARAFERLRENFFRDDILHHQRRPDGRAFDQIRKITCEVGLLPRVHGSALFTRGETQALATLTLGTKEDMQRLDLLFEDEAFKRFMLHYNFPPFSVGEVKFLRGPGRREIGHGALAERALVNLLPPEADFPYAMRLVSDILESNGSSSMATVCGGSLALMDAGVPLRSACAGIAMGLVIEGEQRRGAHRHRRSRRPLRRHGLQSCRHAHRNHRAADGHQGRRHQRAADAPGARASPQSAARDAGHHGPHAHRAPRHACRNTRRACSCSPFPPTRFAT